MKACHSDAGQIEADHCARARGTFALRPLVWVLSCLIAPGGAWAQLPTGFNPVSGSITQSLATPGELALQQNSERAIVNWDSFSIGGQNRVDISQPGTTSMLLNRVTGGLPSEIAGSLTANGRVFLVNPNGVVFGAGSHVSTGGLVASTLEISNDDFNAGRLNFSRADGNQAAIINRGNLQAGPGGTVALLGAVVRNEGSIKADGGTAALVSARQLSLDFQGDGLTTFRIDPSNPASQALVENAATGVVQADGGQVAVLADAGAAAQLVVNQQGVLRARTLVQREGEIVLGVGTDDRAEVGGVLDASGGAGMHGGKINISGGGLYLNDQAVVDVGGATGGGRVDLLAAQSAMLGKGSRLNADARVDGKGGTLNVQGGASLRAYGTLQARGAGSGGGGFIETSAQSVDLAGLSVQATGAPGQLAGTWLIDPFDLRVDHLDCCTEPESPPLRPIITSPFDPVSDSTVYDADISAALNGGSDVRIYTGAGQDGTALGSIFIAPGVAIERTVGEGELNLRFEANNSIQGIGFLVASLAGPVNVFFNSNANSSLPDSADIAFLDSRILTGGGGVYFYGQSDLVNGAASSTTRGVELLDVSIVTLSNQGEAGGDVLIRGRTTTSGDNGVGLDGVSLITGNGNISIRGESAAGTRGLVIQNSAFSTQEGDITLVGMAGGAATASAPRSGVSILASAFSSVSGDIDIRGRAAAVEDGLASDYRIGRVIDPDDGRDPGDDFGFTEIQVGGVNLGEGVAINTNAGNVSLAGQSVGTSGVGLSLASVVINAGNQLLVRAASDDANAFALSFVDSRLSGQGTIQFHPGSVSATGELTEAPATAIQLGGGPDLLGSAFPISNFEISQAVIDQLSTPHLILGSALQSGAIVAVGGTVISTDTTLQAEGSGGTIDIRAPLTASASTLALLADGQITQSEAGIITSEQLLGISHNSSVVLNTPGNAPHVVAGRAAQAFSFTNLDDLTIGTVDGVSGVQAGNVFIRNLTGDLTLEQPVTATAGSAVLVTNGRLQNPTGQAILASSFWQVWADTWVGENRGGLSS